MAKQSGIHKLRGKLDGVSYYRTKYVNEDLARRINTGMSQRVKTAPEYENTRLYNREFGYCARTASQLLTSVLGRYRVILNPFSQGDLVKFLKSKIATDSPNLPLGERQLTPDQNVVAAFNRVFKAPFNETLCPIQATVFESQEEEGPMQYTLSYSLNAVLMNNSAMSKLPNVNGVSVFVSAFHMPFGNFEEELQKYVVWPLRQVFLDSYDNNEFEFGTTSDLTGSVTVTPSTWNIFTPGILQRNMDGFIVYATPYTVIGNEKVYLVDKASAAMVVQDTTE